MCGIAGHLGRQRPSEGAINSTVAQLRHRGPDDEKYLQLPVGGGTFLTLVFARLAIQDLSSASTQPFVTGAGILAFNGEVYNFPELRKELQSLGASFRTSGDTEVLARLLSTYGVAGLRRVEGMYAIAWWDSVKSQLTLVRDSFGEKPLLWMRSGENLWFASEPLALAAISEMPLRPNMAQVCRFLVNGYKSLHKTTDTFHQDVHAIPPATAVVYSSSTEIISEFRLWRPSDHVDPDLSMTYEDAVLGVRERLVRGIEMRLRSDVEVAVALSGGVDSTAIASIAARELNMPLRAFTISSGDPLYDDSAIARSTAASLGLQHTVVDLDRTAFVDRLALLVRHRGEPLTTLTSYAQALLMRAIQRSGIRVVLEGIGADEIFSGYYDHHLAFLADIQDLGLQERALALQAWSSKTRPYVRNPYLQDPRYFVDNPESRRHVYLDADRFADFLKVEFREEFQEEAIGVPVLRRRMLNELMYESVPLLLRESDLNAMSSSLENRSPYLDRGLVEWMSQVPTPLLIRSGLAKSILREAARPWASQSVLFDPEKRGFNVGIGQLLDFKDPYVQREILRDSPIWQLVRGESIKQLLDSSGRYTNSESKFLFSFLSVRAFLEL